MAAASPTPLFPGADPFVAAQVFWLVTYTSSAAGVAGRLTGPASQPSTTVVEAPSSAAARADVAVAGTVVTSVEGPYSSAGDAEDAGSANAASIAHQQQGGTIPGGGVVKDVKNAAAATLGAVDAVPKFLSMLTSGNLWMRAGEVVAGLILLGIGVNALFKGAPMGAVTGAAGKLAPLALA